MIKVEVIEEFTLEDFTALKDIERKSIEEEHRLYVGDRFYCSKTMCDYLLGKNPYKRAFVKVLEVKSKK